MSSRPTSPNAEPAPPPLHRFVVVVPVADRPQHLRACLDSLLELLRRHPYGDGRQISVLIADDSDDAACVADNAALAARYTALGLPCVHFDPERQADLVESLGDERQAVARIIGSARRQRFGHKGQGAMRNIAYLHLARLLGDDPEAGGTLIWSVDSDQEFRVKVDTPEGDAQVFIDYFGALDAIFRRTDVQVLTGKVVGDPPVSPAVMTSNFLDDLIAFLRRMADCDPAAACSHHAAAGRRQGEAAYHDMADLFGFAPAEAYRYRCPLAGSHREGDCFAHFASRLAGFFHGEHPTRVSYYLPDNPLASVQPARTVYAGNYVFRAAALEHFLPFADLRLRMSGPTLGRLVRAQIGPRFVSANLPMLHKRTVEGSTQAEFRPGIEIQREETRRAAPSVSSPPGGRSPQSGDVGGGLIVDMAGEFERQFYGDVMLFTVERLTGQGFPQQAIGEAGIAAAFDGMRAEMLARYNRRHEAIRAKLAEATALLQAPESWWNRSPHQAAAVAAVAAFCASVAHNFAADSTACRAINADEAWADWRAKLIEAVAGYREDCAAWRRLLGMAP
jgi:hypothetical protein